MDSESVRRAVAAAGKAGVPQTLPAPVRAPAPSPDDAAPVVPSGPVFSPPDPRDPVARLERQALVVALQYPQFVPAEEFDAFPDTAFATPAWRAVHDAIRAAGGMAGAAAHPAGQWVEAVIEQSPETVRGIVNQLAVAPLPEDRENVIHGYVKGVIKAFVDLGLTRRVADAKSRLQRLDPAGDQEAYGAAFAELLAVERERRELREQV